MVIWQRNGNGTKDPWADVPNRERPPREAAETIQREASEAISQFDRPLAEAPAPRPTAPARPHAAATSAADGPSRRELSALRARLHRTLISDFDHQGLAQLPIHEARPIVVDMARELVDTDVPASFAGSRVQLLEELVDDVIGLGPLEPLLKDPTVSEVMVNGADSVYVERFGRLQPTDVTFRDDEHVMQILERMLANIGRSIDYSNPMADSRLPDGSRVNAIIPPASIHGPMITIRKFVADRLTAEDLVAIGSLNQAATVVLDAAVSSGAGIVVSGGTGTGKTTLLNVLSGWIPDGERIVTIEDPAELALRQPHVVSLEARAEQNGVEVTRAQLLKNALRMRPDRIIIGEVRGAEAFDMLQAMNTGHDGSMTTVHANSPRDALRRIEQMVMMAGYDWPLRAIREQVSSAIDIVIQVGRLRDGSRRIVDISEVHGMEGDTISMQQLYVFEHRGTDDEGRILGELVPTGLRPRTFDLPGTEDFEDRYDDQIATEVTPIR